MAREFSKTTTNRMTLGTSAIGTLINGAAKISVHARCCLHSTTSAANADRMIQVTVSGSNSGIVLGIDGTGATRRVYCGVRSQNADGFQKRTGTTYAVTLSDWHSLGAMIDIGGDAITPYGGGSADNGGAVTFGAATWTLGSPGISDAIGGDGFFSSANNQIDGLLTDVAVWAGELSADDFAALAAGYSASLIRPDILVSHFLMDQAASENEKDHWGGLTGTIAGTIGAAEDPPIIYSAGVLSVTQADGGGGGPVRNRRRRALICGRAA